jgi:uncharacterized membrane protein (DUF106 family)
MQVRTERQALHPMAVSQVFSIKIFIWLIAKPLATAVYFPKHKVYRGVKVLNRILFHRQTTSNYSCISSFISVPETFKANNFDPWRMELN